jgi:hypothetical protein
MYIMLEHLNSNGSFSCQSSTHHIYHSLVPSLTLAGTGDYFGLTKVCCLKLLSDKSVYFCTITWPTFLTAAFSAFLTGPLLLYSSNYSVYIYCNKQPQNSKMSYIAYAHLLLVHTACITAQMHCTRYDIVVM